MISKIRWLVFVLKIVQQFYGVVVCEVYGRWKPRSCFLIHMLKSIVGPSCQSLAVEPFSNSTFNSTFSLRVEDKAKLIPEVTEICSLRILVSEGKYMGHMWVYFFRPNQNSWNVKTRKRYGIACACKLKPKRNSNRGEAICVPELQKYKTKTNDLNFLRLQILIPNLFSNYYCTP